MRLASRSLSILATVTSFAAACIAQSPATPPEPVTPEISSQTSSQASPQTSSQTSSQAGSETSSQTVNVSQIRIVRLSQVRGKVQLDRKTGQKFEEAFPNLPIVVGEELRTQQGVAEVEFEDNSSLRLTPDSKVEFAQLGRNAAGATTTAVTLQRGGMYLSMADGKRAGEFSVRVGHEILTFAPSSHLRLDTTGTTAKLTVYKGSVTATGDAGSLVVGKRKAITFDLASSATPVFARLDEPTVFDEWDRNAVDYHKARAVAATFANTPYSYGVNDLSYYGAFSDVAGCGTIWRPYLANASFDPYSSGVWTWYPGAGYSWVSLYPWGWLPYHSGSWSYCGNGVGWGWRPQGTWNGLANQPLAQTNTKLKLVGPARPHPPVPPIKGQPTIIGVNLKQLQPSRPGSGDSFVFHGESAGLGVPRGVFGNLNKISQHAAERGSATTNISEMQAERGMLPNSRMQTGLGNGVASGSVGRNNSQRVDAGRAGVTSNASPSSRSSFSSPQPVSNAAPSSAGVSHPSPH